MTTEHLQRIKAKCEQLLELYSQARPEGQTISFSEAGWLSTIAAIDLVLEMEAQGCSFRYFPTVETIIAAWPEELL